MGLGTTCSGSPCAAGQPAPGQTNQPAAIYSIATGVASPSLSGSSTRLTVTASTSNHEDTLFYMPGQPFLSPLATSFTFDFWFTMDQPLVDGAKNPVGPVEALEFDTNINLPGLTYNFSSQCVIKPGNTWAWQIWVFTSGSQQNWLDSGIPCDPSVFVVLPGWNHIVWTYSVNPTLMQKQYVSLSLCTIPNAASPCSTPNVYVPSMPVSVGQAEARSGQKTNIEAQFQIDTRPTNGSPVFNEWVDNVTLTYR